MSKTPEEIVSDVKLMERKITYLRQAYGCSLHDAREVLKQRDWDVYFAKEYLDRKSLAMVCSEEERYPAWHVYKFKEKAASLRKERDGEG